MSRSMLAWALALASGVAAAPALAAEPDDKKPEGAAEPAEPLPVNVRAALEVSGYADDNDVNVLTPGVALGVEDPVNGWGINGSFLVDVVSAASPDIVSMASPRWEDVRYAPALGGHVKVDDWDVSLDGSYSVESDHRSIGAGLGVAVDLANKQVTPSLGYRFGHDTAGRAGTPFDVYSLVMMRHAVLAGVGLVIDKATVLTPAFTYVYETGDQEKPYRYLPIFAPDVALEPGQSVDSVNALRLPVRTAESLPDERHRWAVSAVIAHRFTEVTVRASERLYIDSWGIMATTTDLQIPWDITKRVRIWPHLRFHAQSGADFWQLGYRAEPTAGAPLVLPRYRTGDREMGPLLTGTGGLGLRVALGARTPALTLSGDAIYTRFLDHLYRQNRWAGFSSLLFDVELE